ncbi:UDP-N-acetylmuramoyl-L-alanyl-D-glutamate--2,6-diaminopimelate ligase [Alloiococcus sp. CFN-8]|uniref:UDP-N-acetylmuramoyl-L-alanyl-D-glutamate--2, 6-diaminopimelate ligase n=1 Tax=Alloiococcus sp. CFN-8 TaxID=3416081 RepID=UPI003CE93105
MKLINMIAQLDTIEIKGSLQINISGIAYNSNEVKDNYIFVAIDGFKMDGNEYIKAAISKGAKALVTSRNIIAPEGITVIKVVDTRKALSYLSSIFYDEPSKELELIGITGTNGKTTTTYFVKAILDACKLNTSLIGTIETIINGRHRSSSYTTPESLELHGMFRNMVKEKVDACVMEVSSHAIALSRVDYCSFNVGVFTNLTHEHLDFHGNMENYYNTKKQLFYKTKDFNVINIDDSYGARLAKEIKDNGARLLTYGINRLADINADNIALYESFSEFTFNTPDQNINIKINLPGIYNIYNGLAAAASCYALGIDIKYIKEGLEAVTRVPGRFELVPTNRNINIIIDYAHTPDGFEKVLETINKFYEGRKIIVFGCVGERDRTKRSVMGKIAEQYCDLCVLTTDNCRSEDPEKIIDDIKRGFINGSESYIEILDRAEAIRHAILHSVDRDTIIITGKGHERRQIIGNNVMTFNEREIIDNVLKEISATASYNNFS